MAGFKEQMMERQRACSGQIRWDYCRSEIIADGVIHVTGVLLGLIGAIAIVIITAQA